MLLMAQFFLTDHCLHPLKTWRQDVGITSLSPKIEKNHQKCRDGAGA